MARAKKAAAPTVSAASALTKSLQSTFGKESALIVTEDEDAAGQAREFISTGIDALDHYVIGPGGYAIGRWSEVIGEEGSGKTAFAYAAIAMAQREGGVGVLFDLEHSFDQDRAQLYGVDLDNLVLVDSENAEQAMDQLYHIITMHNPTNGPLFVVLDSIAALVPDVELKGESKDANVAVVARLLSKSFRKINPELKKHRAHVMCINQVRMKIGVMFGPNTTTPGGMALRFYSSVRLQIFGGKAIKVGKAKVHTGKVITVLAIKNRFAPPFRKARVRLDYAEGWNNIWSTMEHAKTHGVITAKTHKYLGKSEEGIQVYEEVLDALGWETSVPVVVSGDESVAGDIADEDDESDEDEDDCDRNATRGVRRHVHQPSRRRWTPVCDRAAPAQEPTCLLHVRGVLRQPTLGDR